MFIKTAYAASANLNEFIVNVNSMIIQPLINFLFALAIVYFLYGMFQFFSNQENEEKKTTGKSHMLCGVIGIPIMMGVWAILGVVINTLGISGQVNPQQGTVNLSP